MGQKKKKRRQRQRAQARATSQERNLPKPFLKRMASFFDAYETAGLAEPGALDHFAAALQTGDVIQGLSYFGHGSGQPSEDVARASMSERWAMTLDPLPWNETHFRLTPLAADGHPSASVQTVAETTEVLTPGKDPWHELGLFYLQEPAAALPVSLVDLRGARRILDLCAAPGGKSSQILARKDPEALLWINEPVPQRLRVLRQNLTRVGAADYLLSQEWAEDLAAKAHCQFDFILLDAPCSGEALLRRIPKTAHQWHRYPPKTVARTQRGILDAIWPRLAPGGRLLYSTCTFNPEENEELIAAFVREREDAIILPFDRPLTEGQRPGLPQPECPDTGLARRVFPQDGWGEGQFAILLQKRGNTTESPADAAPPTILPADTAADDPLTSAFEGAFPEWRARHPEFLLRTWDDYLQAITPAALACVSAHPEIRWAGRGLPLGCLDAAGDFEPTLAWASAVDLDRWPEARALDLTEAVAAGIPLRDFARELTQALPEDQFILLQAWGRGFGWYRKRAGEEPQWLLPPNMQAWL